jgi:hypothetical protein
VNFPAVKEILFLGNSFRATPVVVIVTKHRNVTYQIDVERPKTLDQAKFVFQGPAVGAKVKRPFFTVLADGEGVVGGPAEP